MAVFNASLVKATASQASKLQLKANKSNSGKNTKIYAHERKKTELRLGVETSRCVKWSLKSQQKPVVEGFIL